MEEMDIRTLIRQEMAAMQREANQRAEEERKYAENEDIIPFGEYKGAQIKHVPSDYQIWLCCWQHMPKPICEDSDCDCEGWRCYKVHKYRPQWVRDWRHSVRKHFPKTVAKARKLVKDKNLCHECGTPLVAIGYSRSNGKPHRDWTGRTLHKQCWRAIMNRGRCPYDSDIETDNE